MNLKHQTERIKRDEQQINIITTGAVIVSHSGSKEETEEEHGHGHGSGKKKGGGHGHGHGHPA